MKPFYILILAVFCFSFRPSAGQIEANKRVGFYITVEDLTDRTYHKYIVETKDSVDIIFNTFFHSELDLGDIDRPISIYNGELDFYIARVIIFEMGNGERSFKHLKYPPVYINPKELNKRSQLKPVFL